MSHTTYCQCGNTSWCWSETEGQKIVETVMEVSDCIQPAAEMREFS